MDYQKILTAAVRKQMDIVDDGEFSDAMENVRASGADTGHCGFIWRDDTVDFFLRHRATILAVLEQDASDMGECMLHMVQGLGWLTENGRPLYSVSEIGRVLFGEWHESNDHVVIANALMWYVLEEVASWAEEV